LCDNITLEPSFFAIWDGNQQEKSLGFIILIHMPHVKTSNMNSEFIIIINISSIHS